MRPDSGKNRPAQLPDVTDSVRQWLPLISWEGACANVFVTLTGGAFLTGLALHFHAGDFALGLLNAIPYLAQVVQIISAYFADRTGRRKQMALWGSIVSRQAWWLIIPLIYISGAWRIAMMLSIVAISSLAIMVSTPAWMAWMADIIPDRVRGRYFGLRSAALAGAAIVSTIIGGMVLDYFRGRGEEREGFAVLITAAAAFAALAAHLLQKIPDRSAAVLSIVVTRRHLLQPLRNKNFQHLLRVAGIWNLAIGIAAAFFTAHMLKNLGMNFTQISLYTAVHLLATILFNRPWGVVIDRFGSKPVIVFCAFGITAIPLVWLFLRQDFLWPLIPEAIYSGVLWAGFNLAAFNIPIANSPREGRMMYLAWFSVIPGSAFFISATLGGLLAETWGTVSWQVGSLTLGNYHLMFALTFFLRFLGAIAIGTFHEPDEKKVIAMIHFMGDSVIRRLTLGRWQLPPGPK